MIRSVASRWLSWVLLAVVLLAIWRINDGQVGNIVQSAWGLLNRGADIAISLWEAVIGVFTSSDAGSSGKT